MPDARPATPRSDDSAADMASLVGLGVVEEQPIPSPDPPPPATQPFMEPVFPEGAA